MFLSIPKNNAKNMFLYKLKMLYYDKIADSEEIDVNNTSE